MGAFTSRQNAAVEEAEQLSSHAYKYPPRSGNFFGSHFIMGGERFDTPQPEAYLFGENADLNFLGNRPTAFPYPPPQANEPTKTLKSLVNIRKESVRFVRVTEKLDEVDGNVLCISGSGGDGSGCCMDGDENNSGLERSSNCSYNIEFTFDSDAKCAITIYYFCAEEVSPSGVTLVPRDGLTSETYHYEKGMNQYFSQPTHIFNPQLIPEDDLIYNPAKEQYPVAIHCVVEEGNEECRQSHTTICVIDHHSDSSYVLRALKQKIFVDGLCYLLQEIYGIENKAVNKSAIDEDLDDHGSECVICMSETRDTLILPCRHLCLCNSCADSLRYQANNCPICRAPFRALLQIRAVQKGVSSNLLHQNTPAEPVCDQHIPVGYIPVSLIEALNGPPQYAARSRDTVDSLNSAGNIGDGSNHKATSPNKSNSQRRSKNKKNAASIIAANTASDAATGKNNDSNSVASKNMQNQTLPSVEVVPNEGTASNQKKSSCNNDGSGKGDNLKSRHSQDKLQIVNERNSLKMMKNKRNGGSNLSMNNNNNNSGSTARNADADDDSENEKLSPLLSPGSKSKPLGAKLTKTLSKEGVEESSMIDDVDSGEEQAIEKPKMVKSHKRPALANTEAVVENNSPTVINADDSDYYTPEDTHNSILSPLCPDKAKAASDKLGSNAKSNTSSFKSANSLAMKNLHKKSTSVGNIVGPSGGGVGVVSGIGSTGVGGGGVSDLKGNVSSLPDMLDSPICGGASGAGGNSASTRSSSDSYSSSSSTKQLLSSNPTNVAANIIVDDKTALQNAVNV